MSSCLRNICAFLCLSVLGSAVAQQQTGAPAGIPVPRVPPSTDSTKPPADTAQSFSYRVRVVDGRNGTAIRNAHVKLWYDEPAGAGYEFATDTQGYGNMPAPAAEPLRVLVSVLDYTDCRRPMRGDPPIGYNLQNIAQHGIAAQNGCGRVAIRTSPGELVVFVRPARWYEGLNRNAGNWP